MNNGKSRLGAVLLVLLGASSYGLLSPVFKLASEDGWDAAALVFLQTLSGALLLWILLLASGKARRSLRMNLRTGLLMVLTGIIGLSMTTILYNYSLLRLDASLAIVLLFQYAWITILLESIQARRRPTRSQGIAVLTILSGTVLAVGLLERDLGAVDGLGLTLGLLSAVTYSLFFFLSGHLPQHVEPMAKSGIMTAAAVAFVAVTVGTGSFEGGGSVPLPVWGLLLGMLGTALPTVCFNAGIPRIGSGAAALLGSMELPVAVLASYALLAEPLTWLQGLGIALIVAGVWAAGRRAGHTSAQRTESEE